MKKIMGYGYKLNSETLEQSASVYMSTEADCRGTWPLYKSLKDAKKGLKEEWNEEYIRDISKVKFFKVVVKIV